MLDARHYVPILRWKDAEMGALGQLEEEDQKRITPLVEITPKPFFSRKKDTKVARDPEHVLREQAKDLLKNWGYRPLFLDLQHIDPVIRDIGGSHPLIHLAKIGAEFRLKLIPVTSLHRRSEYQDAVRHVAHAHVLGACIRLTIAEISQADFSRKMQSVLKNLELSKSEMDLLIDLGPFDPQAPSINSLLARIPDLRTWRSLILASGAFPKDLQKFEPGMHMIPREDWLNWKYLVLEDRLQRRPTFSDYAIQYGQYLEPVEFCNPSASIRYTLDEAWLVMRGEGILNENGPGAAQWTANAVLLSESEHFYGPEYSYGDRYISEMTQRKNGHGSPMTWIRAGLNHHMAVVARQIAAL